MKISQEVRDYAAQLGVDEQKALEAGMAEQAQTFKELGGEISVPVDQLTDQLKKQA